jgi:hypothetical protein
MTDERVAAGIAALRVGRFGDPSLLAALRAAADVLDETYFDLQERADDGTAPKEAFMVAFRRARATATVLFALGHNPLVAAREAIYEAYAATDDLESLSNLVRAALRGG